MQIIIRPFGKESHQNYDEIKKIPVDFTTGIFVLL